MGRESKSKVAAEAKREMNKLQTANEKLMKEISDKNVKVAELEAHNSRLTIQCEQLKAQGTTSSDPNMTPPKRKRHRSDESPKKCRYNDIGSCRKKSCKFLHPKKVCAQYNRSKEYSSRPL